MTFAKLAAAILAPFLAMTFGATAVAQSTWLVTPVTEAYPSVSPDGKQVVFQSKRSGRIALWMAGADGSNLRLFLDTGAEPVSAVWSPDGRQIAFAGTVDDDSEIFVVNSDGKNVRRLTSIKADDSHPFWSADGSRLFFSSNRHTPDQTVPFGRQIHDIFSMKPDGSDVRRHTDCKAVCTYPAPSPDGKSLAYRKILLTPGMRWDQSVMPADSEVMVAAIDGTGERALAASPAFDGWPAWSPDGRWIAFSSNRLGQVNTGQVFLVHPDGSGLRQLTSGEFSSTTPRFSPDSRKVYAYRHKDFGDSEIGGLAVTDVPAAG